MINRTNGELSFQDGFGLRPQELFRSSASGKTCLSESLPLPGWLRYRLGQHESEYGTMECEVVCGPEGRLHLVALAHVHSFYDSSTPDDAERKIFHEEILLKDLLGQREFAWGVIHCKTDPSENKNWIVIVYTPGANIPLPVRQLLRQLVEREKSEI